MSRTTTIRVDATSIFYFSIVMLGLMAACVAVGFRLGQEVPELLPSTFANLTQSGAEHRETIVAPAAPVPDETYTFYDTTPEPRANRRRGSQRNAEPTPTPAPAAAAPAAPTRVLAREPVAERSETEVAAVVREAVPARTAPARAPAPTPAPAAAPAPAVVPTPAAVPAAELPSDAPPADPATIERVAVVAPQDSF